ADRLVRFAAERDRQILEDDQGAPATILIAHGPRDRRICRSRDNHLTADLAAHALSDAEPGRSVLSEQSETFGVFHSRVNLIFMKRPSKNADDAGGSPVKR